MVLFPAAVSYQAAQNVLVEHWHNDPEGQQKLRPLNMNDMLAAADSVRPGVTRAEEYSMQNMRSSSSRFDGSTSNGGAANAAGIAQLMAAAAAAAAAQRGSSAGGGGAAKGSSGSAAAAAAGNGTAAAAAETVASPGDAAQDEVYKMVGKMVLNSLSWQQ